MVAGLGRVFRLWQVYAWLDLTWIAQNLTNVLVFLVTDLILNVTAVTTTLLLAARFQGIGPWSRDQVIFMLGYAMLARGIVDTFFGYNVAFISRRVGRGQLDHTLIQPQPIWLALLTDGFIPFSGAAVVVPALGLTVWATSNLGLAVTPGWLALLVLNLLASATIVLAFSFALGSAAFWAPRAAEEISMSAMGVIEQLKQFPLDGVGPLLAGGLLTIAPAGLVAWLPARALLGLDPTPYGGWLTPLAAVVFAALALFIFSRGKRRYDRTGSQRYHAMGHRS
jgi:ABC-2 type transport system permease protein